MKFLSFLALFRVLQYRSYYNSLSLLCHHTSFITCSDIMEDATIARNDHYQGDLVNDIGMEIIGTSSDMLVKYKDESIEKDDRINYYNIQDDDDGDEANASEIKLLPPPIEHDPSERTMQLGDKLSMEHLGPIIVNTDGSLRRIGNWDKLTKAEQDNTFRLIAARNKKRIEILKRKEQDQAN